MASQRPEPFYPLSESMRCVLWACEAKRAAGYGDPSGGHGIFKMLSIKARACGRDRAAV
jgi:hypothetical protein